MPFVVRPSHARACAMAQSALRSPSTSPPPPVRGRHGILLRGNRRRRGRRREPLRGARQDHHSAAHRGGDRQPAGHGLQPAARHLSDVRAQCAAAAAQRLAAAADDRPDPRHRRRDRGRHERRLAVEIHAAEALQGRRRDDGARRIRDRGVLHRLRRGRGRRDQRDATAQARCSARSGCSRPTAAAP